ncbi:nucleoside hydrolase [Undibacterium sp. Ji83W]|uniref:nucleoside hydrolase n=1 Tax=Undibacterium sp. Ji83W TaxID=3413043 RepID=UPI003BF0D892
MKKIIIDCDPGIDDALALLLAASSDKLELLAVTTVTGNRPVAITARNARRILDAAGKMQVPVYAGAALPLGYAEARCNLVHGEDGLGGVGFGADRSVQTGHAATRLIELLLEHEEGSITLVAIGPLTNLALAERLSPGILKRARQLLIMGGALRCPGNVTPAAEFNFYADPVAAEIVITAEASIVLFPLDVTHQVVMSPEWIQSFSTIDTHCGRLAADMLEAYAKLDPLLHDACPVAYLFDSSLFEGEPCAVTVDCRHGPTEGYAMSWFGSQIEGRRENVQAITKVHDVALLTLVRSSINMLS